MRILLELGFEFGEEANITEEWELRFDLLMELLFMRVSPSSFACDKWHLSSRYRCRSYITHISDVCYASPVSIATS